MRLLPTLLAVALIPATLALSGCGGDATTVTRTDPNKVSDLSGNWNATDSQQVATSIISDVTADPWIQKFHDKYNRDPRIKVGKVVNRSTEDISTRIFTNDIRRALRKTGKVEVEASTDESAQQREERRDQDVNASAESRHESFQESGADFLLEGSIDVQNDQAWGAKQKFYAVDLQLTDVKTQQITWDGSTKIAKDVNQKSYR